MSALFGGMLTAISTVYDREFGMLRLMLASPAGIPTLLAGRALAATAVGALQGGVVLVCAPLLVPVTASQLGAAALALVLAAAVSSVLGLLVAAPLQSIENFAGIVNVVLFPLLFLSGALYPTKQLPGLAAPGRRAEPGELRGRPDAGRSRTAGRVHYRAVARRAGRRLGRGVRRGDAAVRSGEEVEKEGGRKQEIRQRCT